MSDAKRQLTVIYDGPDIDVQLDKAIEEALRSLGFTRWASGYDLVNNTRDLAFTKDLPALGRELADEAMQALEADD